MSNLPQTVNLGAALRAEFPIFTAAQRQNAAGGPSHPLVYLDSAATTQKPVAVLRGMSNFLENQYATVHRGAYALSDAASRRYEEVRDKIAAMVGSGVRRDQVIFTRGTTESLNILAWGLGECRVTEADRVVVTTIEHHANMLPWQQTALRKNCEIAYIPLVGSKGRDLRLDLDKARRFITPNTKIVTVAHVGNVLGQINPLADLAEMAHAVGAVFVVDAAQSISSLPVDYFALGADAVAFSAHKMYGPSGVGALVARPELLEEMPPLMVGGGMIETVTLEGATWAKAPAKFEAGTPPIVEVIGFGLAYDWLEGIGRQRIHAHCARLASQLREGLERLPGVTVHSACTGEETLVAFRHERIHAHDLATLLDASNIAVRAGHHCAWPLVRGLGIDALVRASFGAYSDSDDVEALLEAVRHAASVLR